MIKIKYANIHATEHEDSVMNLRVEINKIIDPKHFEKELRVIKDELKLKFPDRHINFVLYSDESLL